MGVGFWQGGLKNLIRIAIVAISIGLAFALYKPIQNWIISSGVGTKLYDNILSFIKDKISVSADTPIGTITIKGTDTVQAWVIKNSNVQTAIFDQINVVSSLRESLSSAINSAVDILSNGNDTYTLMVAEPIAYVLRNIVAAGIAFASIVVAAFIVLMIIYFIVAFVRRAKGKKKTLLSHLLGAVSGFAIAFGICWVISFVFRVGLTFDNKFSEYITSILYLNDDSKWTFAKWFTTTNFGYQSVIDWMAQSISSMTSGIIQASSISSQSI